MSQICDALPSGTILSTATQAVARSPTVPVSLGKRKRREDLEHLLDYPDIGGIPGVPVLNSVHSDRHGWHVHQLNAGSPTAPTVPTPLDLSDPYQPPNSPSSPYASGLGDDDSENNLNKPRSAGGGPPEHGPYNINDLGVYGIDNMASPSPSYFFAGE